MAETALSLKEINFGYASGENLIEVELNIEKGEFIGLIGPNGSGKSTLIKLMAGMTPKKGEIRIFGREVNEMSPKELAKTVAVVPQRLSIDSPFTVRSVVAMGRNPHFGRFGNLTKKDLEAVDRALAMTSIAHLVSRKVTELSGGEYQRVIIAQALAQEAEVLLLDEPTSHLDLSHQLEIMELIKELSLNGKTILVAIHDLNLAAAYARRLIFLRSGRVLADGTLEESFTSQNIFRTFSVPSLVHKNPLTGRLFATYNFDAAKSVDANRPAGVGRIHLICGSGSGAAIMRDLTLMGYEISAGVLNALDSDEEVARALGVPVALEAPFSTISKEAFIFAKELMDEADALIVANIPVGKGNFKNLGLIRPALKAKKPVFILDETPAKERDFCSGRFKGLIDSVLAQGAVRIESKGELMEAVNKWGKRR